MERLRTSGLLEAIEELTPDQRAVLYLRAVADLSVPDIARALDKPETAVKALLRRASASLSEAPGRGGRRVMTTPGTNRGVLRPKSTRAGGKRYRSGLTRRWSQRERGTERHAARR